MSRAFFFIKVLLLLSLILLSQCVSKKKYTTTVNRYEARNRTLIADSIATNHRLSKMIEDSVLMHKKMEELTAQGKKNAYGSVKKTQTISTDKQLDDMAGFIYNITKYVDWPMEVKNESFKIGFLGKTDLNKTTQTKLANKKAGNQKFEFLSFSSIASIKNCHILVISKGNNERIASIKEKLKNYPTLIITENENRIKTGVHVNLRVEGDEVKMAVNKDAVKYTKFSVSEKLLSLSE